jgi:hypothetical protein
MYRPDITLVVILSLPRSGSTVLTAELDRHVGVVSVPETYFPGAVEYAARRRIAISSRLPELFAACCDAGVPLEPAELAECMDPADWRRTLLDIGLRVARRAGRSAEAVTTVIYKTTRLVSLTNLLREAGARFIVLRRDMLNVFGSQFRVDFGVYNRQPLRFAMFHESYEAVFSALPRERVLDVEYGRIPSLLPQTLEWIGSGNGYWTEGTSSHAIAATQPWHAGLLDGFKDSDSEKRAALSARQRQTLLTCQEAVRVLRPVLGAVRQRCDYHLASKLLRRAGCLAS